MYVVVCGGGKVGFYLAKTLINEGHEVLIIEKDKKKCDLIAEELGSVVTRGDAAEASTLGDAGANRADVVVAVTGDDEDNLVICQVAKRKFGVNRTIARINNPKNERIFKVLGIDATVSSTDLIMSHIEAEIPQQALVHLLRLRQANVEIVEGVISAHAEVVGKKLKDITLPPQSVILLVARDAETIIPSGNTALQAGDEVIALTRVEQERALRSLLIG
ncbi:MAG: NAD-binding protein [Chloroflexi bacterium]|nr:NAD-binding protein [Chloroflexota bacterium]